MERPILVTGATGYIGSRLIPLLLERGYRVRAMGRHLDHLRTLEWSAHPHVELVSGDVLDPISLELAMSGCSVAYYFVHAMVREKRDFAKVDREAAETFSRVAQRVSLERIIYLGGLGYECEQLSKHLASRKEVGHILQQSGVPTTVLQAAMIIGAGSASFEILRHLTIRLPLMVTPQWVRTPCQPIAVDNALGYLAGLLEVPESAGQTYDIGGPRVTSYDELIKIFAKAAKLQERWIIPVKVLTPKLSSYWIGLVTPLPPRLGRALIEGLSNRVVCSDNRIRKLIPQTLIDYDEAIERALTPQVEAADSAHH